MNGTGVARESDSYSFLPLHLTSGKGNMWKTNNGRCVRKHKKTPLQPEKMIVTAFFET